MKRLKKGFLLLSLFCVFLPSVKAEEAPVETVGSRWKFAGWYGGGCFPDVEFDSRIKSRVYLTSDVAGIWRSDDLGENWYSIDHGLGHLMVSDLAIAPSDSDVLYAATKGGLFVSKDAGKNWKAAAKVNKDMTFYRPASYRAIAISPSDAGHVTVGTLTGAVFHSENYGESWETYGGKEKPFENTKPIHAVVLDEKNSFLYAASAKGVTRFSLARGIWEMIRKTDAPVYDALMPRGLPLRLLTASENTFQISVDDGDQWQSSAAVSKGTVRRLDYFRDVKNEKGLSLVAAVWEQGWSGGVVLSHDEGKTWQSADKGLEPDLAGDPTRAWSRSGGRTASIKINPFDRKILFRTDWWGAWRSDDGGTTWKEKIKGAPNVVGTDLAIGDKGLVWAASMDNGLLKSRNGGESYEAIFPAFGYKKNVNGHVWRVLLPSSDGLTVMATTSPWEEQTNQVIISHDGGKSFEISRKGLPSGRPRENTMWGQGYPRALAIDPTDPLNVYLGIDGDDGGGLFISKDGGQSWKPSKGQPDSKRVYNGLVVDPKNPQRLFWGACAKGGGVYLSEDGGGHWKRVLSSLPWVFDMAASADGTIYAGGDSNGPALYASRDGGKKWKKVFHHEGKGTVEAIAPNPKNPDTVAFSTVQWGGVSGGRIFLSRSHGESAQDITDDLPEGTGAGAMSFDPEGKNLYMTRYAGSVYKAAVSK